MPITRLNFATSARNERPQPSRPNGNPFARANTRLSHQNPPADSFSPRQSAASQSEPVCTPKQQRKLIARALLENDLATVGRLLLHFDINTPIRDSHTTPLLLAVQHEKAQAAEWLLNKGADINQGNQQGQTPLMLAAGLGDLELVNLLLARGANPLARDQAQRNPLAYAAQGGYVKVVKQLLQADPHALKELEDKGKSALLLTLKGYYERKRSYKLLTPRSIQVQDYTKTLNLVKLLIQHGANVRFTTIAQDNPKSPLYYAAASKHVQATCLLLSQGAPASMAKEPLRTLLEDCIERQNPKPKHVTELLQHQVRPSNPQHWLSPLLLRSRFFSSPQTAETLVQHGANINVRDKRNGNTPLMEATQRGFLGAIEHLMALGADANIANFPQDNRPSHTPFTYAASRQNFAAMYALLKNGADPCPWVDNQRFSNRLYADRPAHEKPNSPPDLKTLWPLKILWSPATQQFITKVMHGDKYPTKGLCPTEIKPPEIGAKYPDKRAK